MLAALLAPQYAVVYNSDRNPSQIFPTGPKTQDLTMLPSPGLTFAFAASLLFAPLEAGAQSTPASSPPLSLPAGVSAFASAVTVEGGEVFVGRPGGVDFFPMPPNRPGGVHVFTQSGGAWSQTALVSPPDAEVGTGYGTSLDVQGDLMVVGAPGEGAGAVYVYRRTDGAWTLQERITWEGAVADARFGAAVATNGTEILAGAPGADNGNGAVVLLADGEAGWERSQVLTAGGSNESARGSAFGTSLDVEDGLAAIGAPGGDISLIPGPDQPSLMPGSVYVFTREADTWSQAAHLAPPGNEPASMGRSVQVSEGSIFAGAPLAQQASGAVYQFEKDDGEWTLANTLQPDSPAPASFFGLALAVSGEDVVAGLPLAGGGTGGGFAFRRNESGGWREVADFGPGGPFNFYGLAVAVGEEVAVVGAPGADFFEGTGHIFRRTPEGWEPQGAIIDDNTGMEAVVGEERECEEGQAGGFDCSEVNLVSFLPVRELGGARGVVANDLWGWTDPESGREYAIVGRTDATTFVDLTNPGSPVYLGELPLTEGATPNLWRDIKVYDNHAFIVADNAGAHGVQVFDLTRLRDVTAPPVTFEADTRYDGISSAHNIVINEATGFAYVVGASGGGETCGGGLHMIDIRDPKNPMFSGCFSDPATGNAGTGYSHDAQCVRYHGPDEAYQDREICFGANEDALSIADVTDKSAPVVLSSAEYPNTGYLHQGWVSEDHRYFYMNDETDELAGNVSRTRTLIWDIQVLEDPMLVKQHFGTTASSDHNLYVLGDYMYQANYVSGLRVLDISNPEEPEEVGFFDTVSAGNDGPGFAGAWSVYPYFESGLIIVSSMREGLFVLKKRPPRVS